MLRIDLESKCVFLCEATENNIGSKVRRKDRIMEENL